MSERERETEMHRIEQYDARVCCVGKGYPPGCVWAVGNHCRKDILYQPHIRHECRIAFIRSYITD